MLIYGLGTIIHKIIPFIMLPIILRILPSPYYYGISDTAMAVVSLGSIIAVMGMYDALFRFYFDNDDPIYQQRSCYTALLTVCCLSACICALFIVFRKALAELIFSDASFSNIIIVIAFNISLTAINSILSAPTRIQNKKLQFIGIQTIAPLLSYSIAIIGIYNGYYVYSLPVAATFSSLFLCIAYGFLNRTKFAITSINKKLFVNMLKFGAPLMPAIIFYWVLSSLSIIVINNKLGLEAAGIYSAASKFAMISQIIYAGFTGGWQYFAFSTMNDDDYPLLIAKIFNMAASLSYFATAILTLIVAPLYSYLFPAEYSAGIKLVPILFLSPLIMMLRQIIGIHFSVRKMSVTGASTVICGGVVTSILLLILVPRLGLIGAAWATFLGYSCSLGLACLYLNKLGVFICSPLFIINSFLIITILFIYNYKIYFIYPLCFLLSISIYISHKNELNKICDIKNKILGGKL